MTPAPETVERRLLAKHLRTELLGPLFDQKDFFPVAVPGVSFDETEAADVAPFTPQEVREDVGFAEIFFRETDRFPNGATSGVNGAGVMETSELTITRCRVILSVPAKSDDAQGRLELHAEKITEAMRGLTIHHVGPPEITLRQLTQNPLRVWRDSDAGDWRRRTIDIPFERRFLRTHQGLQEVTI